MPDQLTYSEIGCGDGNCDFRKPVGMHANGGCKCVPRVPEYGADERARVRRWVRIMRDRIAHLERIETAALAHIAAIRERSGEAAALTELCRALGGDR